VQIELRQEAFYINRIHELELEIKKTTNAQQLSELEVKLAGAKFVFDQFYHAMKNVANIKGESLTKSAKELLPKSCEKWSWMNAEESKGDIAIKMAIKK
jgi:hypothetical protein